MPKEKLLNITGPLSLHVNIFNIYTIHLNLRTLSWLQPFSNVLGSQFTNRSGMFTVPKVIDFPRYNTNCSGENEILREIFRVVSHFPLYVVIYLGNFDYFLNIVN